MTNDKHAPRTTHYAIFALIAAFLALWFVPDVVAWLNRSEDKAWARVQQSGVIRFAIDPSYMPFDGLGSEGVFYGIDVDLAHEIARRIGLRAEFVIAGQDSLYDVLAVGQADATMSALIVNPALIGRWQYSTPYFDVGQVLIKPTGSSTEIASLAVEFGSDGDAAARHWARRQAGIEVRPFQTANEALQAVSTEQVDAAIIDAVSARQLMIKSYPQLQLDDYVTHDLLAIAVWGESTQLLAAINRALAEMQLDGTTERMIEAGLAK